MRMLRQAARGAATIAVVLTVMACAQQEQPTVRPHLAAEIPPCTPVEGADRDPCEPNAPHITRTNLVRWHGGSPYDLRFYLEALQVSGHLVVRGTYLPDTVRCEVRKVLRSSRGGEFRTETGVASFTCYSDIRINAYVLGSGPASLTVVVHAAVDPAPDFTDQALQEKIRSDLERVLVEGGSYGGGIGVDVPVGGIGGREEMMFLGPAMDRSIDSWQVFSTWDVERMADGTVVAVHPWRNHWAAIDYQTHKANIELTLPTFQTRVAEANTARARDNGGRVSPDPNSPMVITTASGLAAFYVETGEAALGMDRPPPPCGKAVPDYLDNHGLVLDCKTLLGVKDTLRGTAALNWSTATAIGSWDGVTVGGTPKRVQSLRLGDKGLTGSIPAALGKLTGLTRLDLSDNQLTGSIPSALGDLSKLEELDLEYNRLGGAIPASLGSLTGLRKLSLSANQLTGSIPSSLGKLTRLTALDLAENRLSGTPPSELGKLKALQYLSLGSNGLTGPVPAWVSGLTALQTLYLDNNALTGSIPGTLGGLSKLTVLSLGRNQLTGSIPAALGNLSKLEELALSGNRLTGSIPDTLTKLKQLEYLYLSGNTLTGCVPAALRKVDNHDLASLRLPDCA